GKGPAPGAHGMTFTTDERAAHGAAPADSAAGCSAQGAGRYVRDLWACRHFWMHLARATIRARFRNSRLGILWALLQPLLLTLLMAFFFGAVFQVPMAEFAPFVFSGLLIWEFVCGAVLVGCTSFVAASPYICQRRLPLAIYPLKNVLSTCTVFSIGMV